MKNNKSKIGEYAYRWEPVEGFKRKDGTTIPPHYKKVKYPWKKNKYKNQKSIFSFS
ncbi:MAG: hypothetical protein R6V50_06430 [Thermoplasmatota archaeon]